MVQGDMMLRIGAVFRLRRHKSPVLAQVGKPLVRRACWRRLCRISCRPLWSGRGALASSGDYTRSNGAGGATWVGLMRLPRGGRLDGQLGIARMQGRYLRLRLGEARNGVGLWRMARKRGWVCGVGGGFLGQS